MVDANVGGYLGTYRQYVAFYSFNEVDISECSIVTIVSNSKNVITEVLQNICYGHPLQFDVEAEFALGKEMSNFLQFLSIY